MLGIDARRLSFPPQQDVQPAITEPAALVGKLAQVDAQLRIRLSPGLSAIALAISIYPDHACAVIRKLVED